MKKKENKGFYITCNDIVFIGFSNNRDKLISNAGRKIFPNLAHANTMEKRISASVKDKFEVIGLSDFDLPLTLIIERVE